MSVIVKGIEMPDNCRNCNCTDDFSCCIFDSHERECDFGLKVRPDWCPLVELPEKHGELIDRNVLSKSVLKWLPHDPCGKEENERPFETDICVSMMMEIEEQPTVIEAEDTE